MPELAQHARLSHTHAACAGTLVHLGVGVLIESTETAHAWGLERGLERKPSRHDKPEVLAE
jgi:hypothetical protein